MAKKDAQVESQVDTSAEGTAPAAGSGKGKKIMLTNVKDGSVVARADFIKDRYAAGVTRSTIVKELQELFNHTVPYQIVFAATKPVKAAAPAVEASAEVAA